MKLKLHATALLALSALAAPAYAQTEIQWWHSMGGALGEWVNDQAKGFNSFAAGLLREVHVRRSRFRLLPFRVRFATGRPS